MENNLLQMISYKPQIKNKTIFKRAKEIILEKGKFRSRGDYVGGGGLDGECYVHTTVSRYSGKNLQINYSKNEYDDKSFREEIEIFEREGIFTKRKVAHSIKNDSSLRIPQCIRGDWISELETTKEKQTQESIKMRRYNEGVKEYWVGNIQTIAGFKKSKKGLEKALKHI